MKKLNVASMVLLCFFSFSSSAQTFKCKLPNGKTEFSDQPCNGGAATEKVQSREYISESQAKSSTDWLRREQNRMQSQERAESRAQQQQIQQEIAAQQRIQEKAGQEQRMRQIAREEADAANPKNVVVFGRDRTSMCTRVSNGTMVCN